MEINTVHLDTAIRLSELLPNLRFVLDHMNQPPIRGGAGSEWNERMKVLSQNPNVHVKISGLGTTAGNNWNEESVFPFIEFVFREFGTKRCFCGGDWPVSLLADSYTNTWQLYRHCVYRLTTNDEAQAIFFNNAAAFYGFDEKLK